MADLHRSRALVRLDGPGHIMPVEPVTPPNSAAWKVVHRPSMMTGLGLAVLAVGVIAISALGVAFQMIGYLPGFRYLAPVSGVLAIVALYYLFVRFVERRPALDELGLDGSLVETGVGFFGGLAWALGTFALMIGLGAVHVVEVGSARGMMLPLLGQVCTAIVMEFILCGLAFRLIERFVGTWLTLAVILAVFGGGRLLGSDATLLPVLAAAIGAGLLFGAAFMVTRRLWASIGLAAAWKIAQVAIYGIAAPGGGMHSILVTYTAGPDWLTGGTAGADASLPMLLCDGVLMAALLIAAKRRGRIVRPVWQRGRVRAAAMLD